ncbi:MAG: crossover junction endodeoxyribonuclease RuvC [Deltaproteobacteria bacterium]|nr:crossover junction endodeoxyribonuclease RuvC [Deltaproteobacteria bacterium]
MIVFGIDPGSLRTGWGVVRVNGSTYEHVASGVIRMNGDLPLAKRLEIIFREITIHLVAHRPEAVYLESLFHHKNARSALVLGHARGAILLAAQLEGRAIEEIAPAEVKLAVTGNGRADKGQVEAMVRIILGRDVGAVRDESDALAIAIAGASRARSPITKLGARL